MCLNDIFVKFFCGWDRNFWLFCYGKWWFRKVEKIGSRKGKGKNLIVWCGWVCEVYKLFLLVCILVVFFLMLIFFCCFLFVVEDVLEEEIGIRDEEKKEKR